MNLSDACGVIGLIGMGLLVVSWVLSIIRRTVLRDGRMQAVRILQRLGIICQIFGIASMWLAGILVLVMASQSYH